jgi:hypothetical protein
MSHSGTIATLLAPDGRIVAQASAFGVPSATGLPLEQERRAGALERLARAMVAALCHPELAAVVPQRTAEQLLECLCTRQGYQVEIADVEADG